MGMFDDVTCEMPLPDGFDGGGFQTRDLGCELASYRITKSGGLVCEKDGMFTVTAGTLDDYHGILNFYTIEVDPNDGTSVWHEYSAKFADGKCAEITVNG